MDLAALKAQNADLASQVYTARIMTALEDVAALRNATNKPPGGVTDPSAHLQLGELLGQAAISQGQWLASAAACTVAAQLANSPLLDLRTRLDVLAKANRGAAVAADAYQTGLSHLQELCGTLGTLVVDAQRAKEQNEVEAASLAARRLEVEADARELARLRQEAAELAALREVEAAARDLDRQRAFEELVEEHRRAAAAAAAAAAVAAAASVSPAPVPAPHVTAAAPEGPPLTVPPMEAPLPSSEGLAAGAAAFESVQPPSPAPTHAAPAPAHGDVSLSAAAAAAAVANGTGDSVGRGLQLGEAAAAPPAPPLSPSIAHAAVPPPGGASEPPPPLPLKEGGLGGPAAPVVAPPPPPPLPWPALPSPARTPAGSSGSGSGRATPPPPPPQSLPPALAAAAAASAASAPPVAPPPAAAVSAAGSSAFSRWPGPGGSEAVSAAGPPAVLAPGPILPAAAAALAPMSPPRHPQQQPQPQQQPDGAAGAVYPSPLTPALGAAATEAAVSAAVPAVSPSVAPPAAASRSASSPPADVDVASVAPEPEAPVQAAPRASLPPPVTSQPLADMPLSAPAQPFVAAADSRQQSYGAPPHQGRVAMSPAQPPPPHTALPVPVEKPQPQQQQPSRAKLPPMTSEEEVAVGTEEEVAAAAASPSAAAEATAEGGQVVGDGGSPLLADVDTLEVHLKFSAEQRRAMSVGQLAHSLALQLRISPLVIRHASTDLYRFERLGLPLLLPPANGTAAAALQPHEQCTLEQLGVPLEAALEVDAGPFDESLGPTAFMGSAAPAAPRPVAAATPAALPAEEAVGADAVGGPESETVLTEADEEEDEVQPPPASASKAAAEGAGRPAEAPLPVAAAPSAAVAWSDAPVPAAAAPTDQQAAPTTPPVTSTLSLPLPPPPPPPPTRPRKASATAPARHAPHASAPPLADTPQTPAPPPVPVAAPAPASAAAPPLPAPTGHAAVPSLSVAAVTAPAASSAPPLAGAVAASAAPVGGSARRWRIPPGAQLIDLTLSDAQLRACCVAELATALSVAHEGRWPARLFLLPPAAAVAGGGALQQLGPDAPGPTLLEDAGALLVDAGFGRASQVVAEWYAAAPAEAAAIQEQQRLAQRSHAAGELVLDLAFDAQQLQTTTLEALARAVRELTGVEPLTIESRGALLHVAPDAAASVAAVTGAAAFPPSTTLAAAGLARTATAVVRFRADAEPSSHAASHGAPEYHAVASPPDSASAAPASGSLREPLLAPPQPQQTQSRFARLLGFGGSRGRTSSVEGAYAQQAARTARSSGASVSSSGSGGPGPGGFPVVSTPDQPHGGISASPRSSATVPSRW